MRIFIVMALTCLSACSWFHTKKAQAPDPSEIIVTGAPLGSVVFIDGIQVGQATTQNGQTQVLEVPVGEHKVEIHVSDRVVYHEETYVGSGEKRTVSVLSGQNR